MSQSLENVPHVLFNPVTWFFAGPLLLGLGLLYLWLYRRFSRTAGVTWMAARYALIASWLGALGWTVFIVFAIAFSTNSTAMLGVMEIPIGGGMIALLAYAISWSLFLLVLRVRRPTLPQSRAAVFCLACLIVLLTAGVSAAYAHSYRLQRMARDASAPEQIEAIYGRWWTGRDNAVLEVIARNPNAPTAVLEELSRSAETNLRYGVARNPSTPSRVLEALFEDEEMHTGLAPNPSTPIPILWKLATSADKMARFNLTYNPNVPDELLEELAKDPRLRKVATNTLQRRKTRQ